MLVGQPRHTAILMAQPYLCTCVPLSSFAAARTHHVPQLPLRLCMPTPSFPVSVAFLQHLPLLCPSLARAPQVVMSVIGQGLPSVFDDEPALRGEDTLRVKSGCELRPYEVVGLYSGEVSARWPHWPSGRSAGGRRADEVTALLTEIVACRVGGFVAGQRRTDAPASHTWCELRQLVMRVHPCTSSRTPNRARRHSCTRTGRRSPTLTPSPALTSPACLRASMSSAGARASANTQCATAPRRR